MTTMSLAKTVDEELWRRSQARREAAMGEGASEPDQMLLPLVLSLARLAAQRDARASRAISTSTGA